MPSYESPSQPATLDTAPPRPPRNRTSIMSMGSGEDPNLAVDMSSPAVRVMSALGEARNALLALGSELPLLAPGIQQIITGLETVVPQQIADLVAGNPPGSGGSGMGAPGANAAPTAPPVQTGIG